MHICDMISFWARTRPHHPAIIQPDTIITYRGLDDAINSAGQRIAELGLDPREPVAVAIENPAKELAVCFGLLRRGFTTAPAFPAMMPHLRAAGINNVIYEGEGQILSGGRNIRFENSWLLNPAPPQDLPARVNKQPDMIFFTSGATGLPKKFIQTEASLIARLNICAMSGDQNYQRILVMPALGSNYGFTRTCEALREGKTACFALPGPGRLVLISTYGVDRIIGSPQQLLELLNARDANPGHSLDSLRSIRIGGAMASRDLIKRVQSSLCRNVATDYGSTEASLIAVGLNDLTAEVPDAVGFIGVWTELEIIDDNDNPLPPGREGRIRLRTPFFVLNYAVNNPGFTGDAAQQWYYPGDIGTVTDNGILCVRGRADDIINCGGHKVSAGRLEDILKACPGIADAGACGIKSEAGIEELWIGLVPKSDFDPARLQSQLEQDETFGPILRSVGAEVVSIEAVPRNEIGKVKRADLRAKLIALSRPSQIN